MPKRKVIKFKNRGNADKEKILQAVEQFKGFLQEGSISEVCLVWRRHEQNPEDPDTEYMLTDFIWHVSQDKLPLVGLLEYMKSKVLENFKSYDS